MRIKHFAGYGCVNAKKIKKEVFYDEYGKAQTELVVKVSGVHEWGLERDDSLDLYNWLVKRFDKNVPNYYTNDFWLKLKYSFHTEYVGYEEHCTYTFTYPCN